MEGLISQILQSDSPDSLIESVVISDLKKYSKYDPFDSQHEVKILINFYKDIINFSKTVLFFSTPNQILFFKLSNELICSGTIKKPRASIPDLNLLINSYNIHFNPSDLSSIKSFFSSNYFQHIRLYNCILSSKENAETAHIQVWVDSPLPSLPLYQSVQRLKSKPSTEEEDETNVIQKSRSKVINQRKGNDSKEPSQDLILESPLPDNQEIDPVENTFSKLQVEIDAELQKREALIEVEIEELKKKYR
jgi:Flagellar C1a complex subunit C1a-32